MAVLVTGGARSGKSAFAEQYASRIAGDGVYVATSRIWDDEMAERVEKHRKDRAASGFRWRTVEEPLELAAALEREGEEAAGRVERGERPPAVLIDCLTLWLSNWLLKAEEESLPPETIDRKTAELAEAVGRYAYPLVIVTNEVGDGVVPAYPLGRRFRDEAGRLNQRIARRCDRVFLVTAGIPVELKTLAFKWENL